MSGDKLKFYIKRSWMRGDLSYSPLLFPFLGSDINPGAVFTYATFSMLNFDSAYYELVEDIEDADFVFIPHNYWILKKKDPFLIDKYIAIAQEYNKVILIDAVGDTMEQINIPDCVILRLAQYRTRLRDNDIIVPCYVEDILTAYCKGELSLRDKNDVPAIGFSGWTNLPFLKFPRTYLKDLPLRLLSIFSDKYTIFRKGIFLRQKAINSLEKSNLINTQFIKRLFFSGNTKTAVGDMVQIRSQFINNIIGTDYSLCVKGDANASTRFYEILSLGRIPFFVDTDCVLPLEDKIAYEDFCVFVDYDKVDKLGEELRDFHRNISPERFREMQEKGRLAFEKYLRIDVFTEHLMEKLSVYVRKRK